MKAPNPQQQLFITEYRSDPSNATAAAVAAGYSEHTARVTACKLLKKPHIIAELERLSAESNVRISAALANREAGEIAVKVADDYTRRKLFEMIEGADLSETTPADAARALDMLNKIDGKYAPTQIQATIDTSEHAAAARDKFDVMFPLTDEPTPVH